MANTYTVSTQSTLLSALSSAQGGDTIVLANGNYGSVTLTQDYSSFVTIKAQNPKGAAFNGLTFSGATNIRVDGVKVSGTTLSVLDNSRAITIENSEIAGTGQFGLRAKDVSELTFKNNYVHDVHFGVAFFGVKGLTVTGNTVDYTSSDGYKYGGVSSFLIENNRHGGHINAASYSHSDFMQFLGGMNDGVIRGNVYLAQNKTNVQGLFFTGQASHHNVLIEQNIIYTGMANGITMPNGSGITVRHNTVLTVPNDTIKASYISVPAGSVVENNINTLPTGSLSGSNVRVQYSNPGGAYHYSDLFVNAMKGVGITLADLRPVADSLATTKGAYVRLMELLDGTAPAPDTNSAPDAIADNATTDAGKAVTVKVLANDTDADGDALSLVSVGKAASGTVTKNADGTVTYTPNAGFSGTDSFSYTISDGELTDTATVKVTVNAPAPEPAPNTAPDAIADSATTDAGKAVIVKVLANDTDAEGDALSLVSVGQAASGTVTKNADGTVTYTPKAGFSGTDSFSYTISDGELTDTATVKVTVNAPAPDPESEVIFAKLGSQTFSGASSGVIEVAHSAAFAVPAATIAFSFKADTVSGMRGLLSKDASGYGSGGHFTSYVENGTLCVRFQNASADKIFKVTGIKAGTEYDFQASFGGGKVAVWLDGKLIGEAAFSMSWEKNVEVMQIGANGWGSAAGAKGFTGPFDGTISNVVIAEGVHSLAEMAALIAPAAEPLNSAPEALDDSAFTTAGKAVTVDVLANDKDADGDALSLVSAGSPASGSVTKNADGSLTYTPDAGFFGTDEFVYAVSDGQGGSDTAKVSVTVAPPAAGPVFSLAGSRDYSGKFADVYETAHQPGLEIAEGTISLSFTSDNVSGRKALFSKDAKGFSGDGNHVTIFVENGKLVARFQDGDSAAKLSVDGITTGQEYDVMASFDQEGVALWLDGKLVATDDLAMSLEGNREFLQIGASGEWSESGAAGFACPFDGRIADVRIFDQALTADELALLY